MALRRPHLAAGPMLWLVLIAASCAGSTAVPPVTAGDTSRAASRWPGTGQAQLEAGRSLYLERCSSCHVPPAPSSVAAEDWPMHVQEMKERAGLADGDAALVERYLITIASRAPTP